MPETALSLPDGPIAGSGGVLRAWSSADAPSLVEAWRDPDIVRYNQVPAEPTEAKALRWISGCAELVARGLSLDLVIESEGVAGEVGLSGFDARRRAALIGYWLLPASRGRGLATAAVQAMASWASVELGLETIVAKCAPLNVASHRVAANAGFVYEQDHPSGDQLWVFRPLDD